MAILSFNSSMFLFVPRWAASLIVTSIMVFLLSRIPTAGKPLYVWIIYVPMFLLFRPKVTRAFQPVKVKKRWRENWTTAFRAVIAKSDKEVSYTMLPLQGRVRKFEGLTFRTWGATRFIFHPLSRQVSIKVAPYENLNPRSATINGLNTTVFDAGRGEVRIRKKAGRTNVQYNPIVEEEEALYGRKGKKADIG